MPERTQAEVLYLRWILSRIIRGTDNDVIHAQNLALIMNAIFEFFADYSGYRKCNHIDSINSNASCDFWGDSHIFKGIFANKVI